MSNHTLIKSHKTPNFVSRFKPGTFFFVIALIALIIHFPKRVSSQESDTINYIEACNKVFKQNIKTVLFHREGWDMSPPLINLGSQEKLKLSFDDLDADKKDYLYTIVHCDAGWKPSELMENEYINGYFEDDITEYSFSLNTLVPYTHYELSFPSEYMTPEKSGNYILKVYLETPDSIYLTRRFMILENKLNIEGRATPASGIEERYYKQEVDFTVNTSGLKIANPFSDLIVVVCQNGRCDNALRNLTPKMVVGEKLDYDYDGEIIFNGGNEFRSFDIKSLKYNSEHVLKINKEYSGYNVILRSDERKTFTIYRRQDDINGMMKIKTEDSDVSETESEYVNVHFFLSYEAPFINEDLYIIGQLTDWQYSEVSKMYYNYPRKGYEKTLLLKQGYYNYQYVLRNSNQSFGDETLIEGNHSETGNTYTIYIYYSDPASDYDRLVGVKHFNTAEP